jgi:Reverse transcriptase (RNA-dependent DNA polymerase)
VSGITASTQTPLECPRSFHAAMKSPHRGEWLAALFMHLDSCHAIGTFGAPTLPPHGVTVLPAVLVLKHVVNSAKQVDERKVRLCVNGSYQVKGIDYTESFAPTILAMSIKVFLAIAMYMQYDIYHLDISNAFQNTPAPPNASGQRIWLRLFPEYLLWYKTRFPLSYVKIDSLLRQSKRSSKDLAVVMFAQVQGRRDASRGWGELVDTVIEGELKLTKNRADQCIYQGYITLPSTLNKHHIIMARATDDIMVATNHKTAYDYVVSIFESHWKVHNMGPITHFFGLRFIFSPKCMTIDQTHLVHEILTYVHGSSWSKQEYTKSNVVPMITGIQHEELLAGCVPYDDPELKTAVSRFGFTYRTLLGKLQHLCQWTRLDIQTAVQRLAQYQNAPGELHFIALLQIVKYLRAYPDLPLTFARYVNPSNVISVGSISGSSAWISDPTVSNVEAHHFGGQQTFWNEETLSTQAITTTSSTLLAQKHFPTIAPETIGYADANFGGALFDRIAHSGGVVMINGTAVITVCRKQSTTAYNTTEAELDAATTLSKHILWLRLYMDDMNIPYHNAVTIGEDNTAAQIIAHAGKLTRNVRHVATKTQALQEHVRHGRIAFSRVSSALNLSDHFTKALPFKALREHCMHMMGYFFP